MRQILLFAVVLSVSTVAWSTPLGVTGTFHDGGYTSWVFQGQGINFLTTQGQTAYQMTTCYVGQACDISGMFPTFFSDEGSATLTYAGKQYTELQLSGQFNWSADPLELKSADVKSARFRRSVPVGITAELTAFVDPSQTQKAAEFTLTGTGTLLLSDLQGAVSPGKWVVVVGDGTFTGDLEATQIPEPATVVLIVGAAAVTVLLRRRRFGTPIGISGSRET